MRLRTIREKLGYRTRLVADVVTGKVDVRAAAAKLPVVAAESVEPETAELPDESELEEAENVEA